MTTCPIALGDSFFDNPHAVYEQLGAHGVLNRVTLPTGLNVWLVTGYEEGRSLLTDARLSKDLMNAGELFERHQSDMGRQRDFSHAVNKTMLNMDPPEHTRLRRLVSSAFTPKSVAALRPQVERDVQGLLDELVGRDEFDLLADFAVPLIGGTISALLGVPPGDRAEFQSQTAVLTTDSDRALALAASDVLVAMIGDMIRSKRTRMTDDLLSALISVADGSDKLDDEEVVSIVILLLIGGTDTTVNLVGNGSLALMRHPDQLEILRAEPTLWPDAINELLRYDGSASMTHFRFTMEPIEVAGTTIEAGEFVMVGLSAANRDERRFESPDTLDVRRNSTGHMAFGHGVHHCLGAALARLEGEVALQGIFDRMPDLSLAIEPDRVQWRQSTLFRGARTLPVRPTVGP